jgi:HAD superfamily hydrolase (TIGR01509 family)
LDGTLADTMPLHRRAWHLAFDYFGEEYPEAFIDQHRGIPAGRIAEIYTAKFDTTIDPAELAQQKNEHLRKLLHQVQPLAPVQAVVKQYNEKLPMAIASGGTLFNVLLTLEAMGLSNYFEVILTSDDSIEPKPSPDIFLEAARRLRIPPEYCQVFEDGEAGLIAARKAGMLVTDVRPYLTGL